MTCSKFNNLQGGAKDAFQPEHKLPLERKEEAQQLKKEQETFSRKQSLSSNVMRCFGAP